jgi:hypothetical protein
MIGKIHWMQFLKASLVLFLTTAPGRSASAADYLPLSAGTKWVLKSPVTPSPAVFEVLQKEDQGFRIRFTNPWGSSQWTVVEEGGKLVMTAYGESDQLSPLPKQPVYLDFTQRPGAQWTNSLGNFTMVSTNAVVKVGDTTYRDCIQIRQKVGSAKLAFTFAPGIGYVQFGEGPPAFVLDPSASNLTGSREPRDARARASVQAGRASIEAPESAPPPRRQGSVKGDHILFGLTPNRFAFEPLSVEVMMRRFQQTVEAGIGFLVGNGKWSELEPRPGQYDLDSLRQLIPITVSNGLPLYYSLHVIDTIARDVPRDLQQVPWGDPRMQARVLALIDAVAPVLKGHARWFSFGYEIDGYFEKHPGEVQKFVELQRLAAERLKQLAPGIEVSTTLTHDGLEELPRRFATLDRQMDFLALTYCPLKPNFTVKQPSVLPSDFERMREFARNRGIVLQEIAYPTSSASESDETKQAEFYRLAFEELSRRPAPFEAVSFMTLADLSDAATEQFAQYYGMKHSREFRGAIQSLGMFDGNGRPKKGWDVFQGELRHYLNGIPR